MKHLIAIILSIASVSAFGQITAITDTSVTVTGPDCLWKSIGSRSYRIEVNGVAVNPDFADVGPHTITGLTPGTDYDIRGACVDTSNRAQVYWGPLYSFSTQGANPASDWLARSTAPGVIYATNFDTETEVTDHVLPDGEASQVTWEQSIKKSGGGALRFEMLNTNGTNFGNWYRCWSEPCQNLGPNEEIYIQFRQYTTEYLVNHDWEHTGSSRTGFKQIIISRGSSPGSNTPYEVVLTDDSVGFPIGYWQDGQVSARLFQDNANTDCSSTDFRMQNVVDRGANTLTGLSPDGDAWTACEQARAQYGGLYSVYRDPYNIDTLPADPISGAWKYPLDGWATYMVHIRLGPSGLGGSGNLLEIYAAHEGEGFELIMQETNATLGPEYGNGDGMNGFWLLPYISRGIPDAGRQNTYTVYDEVIVSNQPIAAPAADGGNTPEPSNLLEQTIADCPVKEWCAIPASMATTIRAAMEEFSGDAGATLYYANKLIYDYEHKKIVFVGNKGGCCNAEEYGIFSYDADTNTATHIAYEPGTNSGHVYDGNAEYDPDLDQIWYHQYFSRRPKPLNTVTNTFGAEIPSNGPPADAGQGATFHRARRELFVIGLNEARSWDVDNGGWTNYTGENWGNYHSFGVYNPTHETIWVGAGNSAPRDTCLLGSTGTNFSCVDSALIPFDLNINNAHIVYDPAGGNYLIHDKGGTDWREFDPTTPTVAPQPITGMVNTPATQHTPGQGGRSAVVALETLGAIMLLDLTPSQLNGYVFKTEESSAPADTQAPSTPPAPALDSKTANSVSFSWTPSIDDTGVTGYEVYQDNVSIGTTASTSYTASSLVPATSYDFAIEAYDAASNVSPRGPPLTETTNAATVNVPDVVGQVQASAESAITGAGLSVGVVTTATSGTVASGSVISQTPSSGASVSPGSSVNLVVSSGPEMVIVPDVVGQVQASAESAITGAGLSVGVVTTATSGTVASGSVISQTPSSGASVSLGSSVNIVVSSGPEMVTVPDVVGQTRNSAEVVIANIGLTVGNITAASSATVAAGLVATQSPLAGTSVAANSAVDIVISSGPGDVVVPNVVGQAQVAAEAAIAASGLSVGTISTQTSVTVAAGSVISQSLTAGSTVAAGTAVGIVVSSGPAQIAVPDVVGQVQATAQFNITSAGLTVGAVTSSSNLTVPAGNVISQSPLAGATVDEASAVDLLVSTGISMVLVPDVAGQTQTAAEAQVAVAGLTVGSVTFESSASVASGLAIRTDPAAGQSVASGTTVDIVVSSGPLPVLVPNVAGLTQTAAQSAIVAAGLTVGSVSQENSATVDAQLVIRSDPAQGTSVPLATDIDLVISLGPSQGSLVTTQFVRMTRIGDKSQLDIYSKNDVLLIFTVQDFDQKPVDVTNYSGHLYVAESRHSQARLVIDNVAEIFGDPENGQLAVTLTGVQTARTGRDYFEFVVTDPNGSSSTIAFGQIRWVRTLGR